MMNTGIKLTKETKYYPNFQYDENRRTIRTLETYMSSQFFLINPIPIRCEGRGRGEADYAHHIGASFQLFGTLHNF